jgi:hypothetical protein
MKTVSLFAFFICFSAYAFAQEPSDALRYSFLTQGGGTARNQAIGGAGASLGGEFSSLFINPAGLGFYKTGDFAVTPGFAIKSNNGNYLGSDSKINSNNFNLGASGFVFSSPSYGKGIKSVSFALGVSRSADFSNHIYYSGINRQSSYSEKFLEELANNKVSDPNNAAKLYPYGTSEAFNTYLINPVYGADSLVTGYTTLANPNFGLKQENTVNTSGGITDAAVGAGVNVQDKWYFGGTLSFPFLNYVRNTSYRETDISGDTHNNFNFFQIDDYLRTHGVGINGKFGVIFKPVTDFRLGLSLYTPTFFQLTDTYTTKVTTDLEGFGGSGIKYQSSTDLDETNHQPGQAKYNLTTPWRAIFSASYVFKEAENVQNQRGFVTADVEYVNYKDASFHAVDNNQSTKDYYSSLNSTVDNLYKNAINVRLGGEVKFDTYMFRLGGAYYGNPYQAQSADLVKLSGGVGYRNRGIFIDLTYVYSMNKDVQYPYVLQDKPNVPAYLKNNAGNIIATLGFKL